MNQGIASQEGDAIP